MESLRKNETWDIVALPNGWNPIGSMWVFKINTNATRHVEKFKAGLVDKGYLQIQVVDIADIFSLITKLTFI